MKQETYDTTIDIKSLESLQGDGELLRSVLNLMPVGVDIIDGKGNILFVNKALDKALGGEKVLGKRCFEVYSSECKQCKDCPLKEELILGGTKKVYASNVLGGKYFDIHHTVIMYEGQKALLEVFVDVTAHRNHEEAEKKKIRFFRFIQRITDMANRASSETEAMQACLDIICDFTGWPVGHIYVPSEVDSHVFVSAKLWKVEDEEKFQAFKEITEKTTFVEGQGLPGRVIETGKPAWIADIEKDKNFPRKNCKRALHVGAAFAFPIMEEDRVVAVMEFFSENPEHPDEYLLDALARLTIQIGRVTERKRNLEALQESNKKLVTLSKMKDEFISVASHELRTPMSVIRTYASLLLEKTFGELNEKQKDFLERIFSNTTELVQLVNDLLDISKLDAGAMAFDFSDLNIEEFSHRLIENMQLVFKDKKIHLTCDVDLPDDKKIVKVDSVRLNQVLTNLLGNALKFTPDEGDVSVFVVEHKQNPELIEVQVKDTGIGIAEEKQKVIFEKFGQAQETLQRDYEGTGLGLCITKTIVEKMGGTIWVESKPGQGSVFFFTLSVVGQK